jgi:prepilin peptidase CpaA
MLVAVLGVAVISDVRSRRIPNGLILAGLFSAVLWHAISPAGVWAFDPGDPGGVGWLGALIASVGLLVAFFPLYALRVMGAGDVKLLAVVGGFFGVSSGNWSHLLGLALSVLVAGGALALARMLVSGRFSILFQNVRIVLLGTAMRLRGIPGPDFDAKEDSSFQLPYAVAIALGSLSYSLGKYFGWLTLI